MAESDKHLSRNYDVFISYDTENEKETYAAARLAEALRVRGYSVWWDRELRSGQNWRAQIELKAVTSSKIVTLETARYHTREMCLFELEVGERQGTLKRFKIEDCETAAHLKPLIDRIQFVRVDPLADAYLATILDHLADLAPSEEPRLRPQPTVHVDLGDLPEAPARLIGREAELEMLHGAWAGGATNLVVLHALGGAGKSALLGEFVADLLAKGGGGAARIYGWSAYSQGSDQRKGADADGFINDALSFFGGDPAAHKDGVARARDLARRVAAERSLLLLDGIEPLQNPPHVDGGRLKNKALATLIKALAANNSGLVVVTSRQPLPEVSQWVNKGLATNWPLEELSTEAGVELLLWLGVTGRRRDLERAVEEQYGHALSITLLGTFLASVEAGDVARRDQFRFEEIEPAATEATVDETDALARRAERVMAGYLEQLDGLEAAGGGAPERVLLSLLGLFDRPADGAAVRALLAGPAIPGLTDPLFAAFDLGEEGLTEAALSQHQRAKRWQWAKARLRQLRLLGPEDRADKDALDAHPIVRNYFRKRLSETEPEAWRAAHARLYAHYAATAPELPETVEAMQPLFHACAHGVAAGKVQEAWSEIYYARIRRRGQGSYIANQLGAFDATLAVLAQFFARPWATPLPELPSSAQAAALNYAAFALRGLGRLADAAEPMRADIAMEVERENWIGAAPSTGNLSELLLTIGDVAAARAAGAEAVEYADKSGDLAQRMIARTQAADAAHQAGAREEAARLFEAAERLQAEHQPELPRLYSVWGYRYCDLLLTSGAAAAALERAEWLVSINKTQPDILSRALHTLALGRAQAALAGAPAAEGGWLDQLLGRAAAPDPDRAARLAAASAHLDDAVAGLRAAGQEFMLVHGLLARAAFLRARCAEGGATAQADRAAATTDLDEAQEIADYGGMGLFKADIALERARWAVMDQDKAAARPHLEAARAQIESCGYGRLTPELEALEQATR